MTIIVVNVTSHHQQRECQERNDSSGGNSGGQTLRTIEDQGRRSLILGLVSSPKLEQYVSFWPQRTGTTLLHVTYVH